MVQSSPDDYHLSLLKAIDWLQELELLYITYDDVNLTEIERQSHHQSLFFFEHLMTYFIAWSRTYSVVLEYLMVCSHIINHAVDLTTYLVSLGSLVANSRSISRAQKHGHVFPFQRIQREIPYGNFS